MTTVSFKKHRKPAPFDQALRDEWLREQRQQDARAYDAAIQAHREATHQPRTLKRAAFDALSPAERVATMRRGIVIED